MTRDPRVTTRTEFALGMFALFLLGLIGAAAGFSERLRRLAPAASHNAPAAAVRRCEIR
jgi:hypothetical protein